MASLHLFFRSLTNYPLSTDLEVWDGKQNKHLMIQVETKT